MKSKTELLEEWLNEENYSKTLSFSCVDECNDDHAEVFLKEQALELMQRNLVRTRLFFDYRQNLIGFYSLFNDTVKMNKDKRKALEVQLPQNVKEIPAIRLHYIGVDDEYRGKGYGEYLMTSMIVNCATVAKISGCTLITLESTKGVVDFYRKYGFEYVHPVGDYILMAMNTKKLIDLV